MNPPNPHQPPDESEIEEIRHDAEEKIQAIEQAKAREEASALTKWAKISLFTTTALLALAWHRTFMEMWGRWFPAWRLEKLPLMERLTEGDSYYTHGPLVPLTCLIMAGFIHKRVGLPLHRTRGATILGWLLLVVFFTFHLLSVSPSARVMFVSGFALIGVIGGLILIWGGWPLAKAYWLPVVFLAFMIPLPEVAIGDLNFKLKNIAGDASLWLTNNVFAVPAVKDGSYVYLSPDPVTGEPKTLVIENVCSGLRSLISLVWFASLFAVVCRVKGYWRLFMLAMAVPVAVVTNVIRITALNVVAHHYSIAAAGPGAWFHDLSGLLVFAMALAILFGLEQAIIGLSKLLKKDWVDHRLLGFLEKIPRLDAVRRGPVPPVAVATLTAVAAMSLYWSVYTWDQSFSVEIGDVVPKRVELDGRVYIGQDHELDEQSLIILEYPDYIYRRYFDAPTFTGVDLLIVFSANNRKGTHPPEVCIEGGGDRITTKKIETVPVEGLGDLDMRQLLTQRGNRMTQFLYIYKCGSRYTSSFFAQQFWIFVNGLLARDTAGALIRISVPADPRDTEAAAKLAQQAAQALLPHIDKGLP